MTTPSADRNTSTRIAVGKKLADLRQRLNCTQAEMGKALGVHPSYLSHVERGYVGISLDHADKLVRKAYQDFSVPLDLPVHAAPAEVDAEVINGARTTPAEVGRRIVEFQKEFGVSAADSAALFGVSRGHEYVLRSGRNTSGPATRRKVLAIIERETQARRAATTHTAEPQVTAAPAIAPPSPRPGVAPESPAPGSTAKVVPDVLTLVASLEMDFKTAHRFTKLPDGSFLILKGV